MLALERHPVCCLLHRHRRMAGQQIDHHARMRRIEMLDQNEGHAGAGREGGEQSPGSIEAPSRGAETDNREAVMPRDESQASATNAEPTGGRAAPAFRGPFSIIC